MELTALAQARLIVFAVAFAVIASWGIAVSSTRRRRRRFAALARSLNVEALDEGRFLSRFRVGVEGRAIEVLYQHIGGRTGVGWTSDWYLVTTVPLHGISELHSAGIHLRTRRSRLGNPSEAEFKENFSVRDEGYPLRTGWLTDRTRGAIYEFYRPDLPLEPLMIEEAKLVHRSRHLLRHLESGGLRELLGRQAAVAAALESSL
jgi:hypothetical protein